MQENKRNKVLITGASQGVGLALSKELATLPNIELILVARQQQTLKQAELDLLKLNPKILVRSIPCDLSDHAQIENLFRTVPQVDILVNNAGMAVFGSFSKQSVEESMKMIRLNCEAPIRLMHHYMKSASTIVNISSLASIFPMPYFSVYSATKAFLTQLGEALSVELQDKGISLITVCPGGIKTQFHIHAGLSDEITEKFGSTMITPEQVARAVVKGLNHKSSLVVPGFTNRFFIFLSRFFSKNFITRLIGSTYKKYDRT